MNRKNEVSEISKQTEEVIKVPLRDGYSTLIDIQYYDWMQQWIDRWLTYLKPDRTRIVVRTVYNKKFFLSRELMIEAGISVKSGDIVAYVSEDTLDNRLSNLRVGTRSELSRAVDTKGSWRLLQGYPGVTYDRKTQKYRACLEVEGKRKSLGVFDTPEEASLSYQAAINSSS